jgi:eukaryotic-like serine/threonine-protein kinase
MAPDRLQRAFEVFDTAAALPRGERDGFLAQECGADAELREDVVSLLAAHDEAEGFLSRRRSRSGSSHPIQAVIDLPGLALGTHLGNFRIERVVGAGGMGVVYKARDTRLDRDVAIKVLRGDSSGDPRRHARFSFEARAIARLSHPRICALHDIAHHDGIDFLVMEFLEGETLAERMRRRPMSPAEALRVAREIAEALSAAHSRGIVHRDLKPANVMLTANGARLLDFGLARLKAGYGPAVDPLIDPTSDQTAPAIVAGTLQYMAPEQLDGKEVDARADIFAFGVVFYEMLERRRPFEGTTTQDLLSAVRSGEPAPITTVAALGPGALDRVIRTCLAADPDERWASIRDVQLQLEWIARDLAQGGSELADQQRRRRRQVAWKVAAGVALTAALGAGVWSNAWRSTTRSESRVFPVAAPAGVVFAAESPPAISADGRRLAFVATDGTGRQLLYHQALDSYAEAQAITNTDGALFPFWSPDGTRLGFFADGQLKTVHLESGRIQPLAPAGQPRGGTWNADDVIVFVPRPLDGFYRIPAAGGQTVQLELNVSGAPGWYPSFLPDGRHLLVYVPSPADPEKARIALISLDAPTRTDLISGTRSNAIFAQPGHLLFWREGTLMAQPFDPATRRIHGSATALPGAAGLNPLTNLALFSVSASGTLVYFGGAVGQARMEWLDRFGRPAGPIGPTGVFNSLSLSPDNRQVVYDESSGRSGSVDLHRYDFATGRPTRLTFNPAHDMFPVWARDGSRIFFNSLRTDRRGKHRKRSWDSQDALPCGPERRIARWEAAAVPERARRYQQRRTRDGPRRRPGRDASAAISEQRGARHSFAERTAARVRIERGSELRGVRAAVPGHNRKSAVANLVRRRLRTILAARRKGTVLPWTRSHPDVSPGEADRRDV